MTKLNINNGATNHQHDQLFDHVTGSSTIAASHVTRWARISATGVQEICQIKLLMCALSTLLLVRSLPKVRGSKHHQKELKGICPCYIHIYRILYISYKYIYIGLSWCEELNWWKCNTGKWKIVVLVIVTVMKSCSCCGFENMHLYIFWSSPLESWWRFQGCWGHWVGGGNNPNPAQVTSPSPLTQTQWRSNSGRVHA